MSKQTFRFANGSTMVWDDEHSEIIRGSSPPRALEEFEQGAQYNMARVNDLPTSEAARLALRLSIGGESPDTIYAHPDVADYLLVVNERRIHWYWRTWYVIYRWLSAPKCWWREAGRWWIDDWRRCNDER